MKKIVFLLLVLAALLTACSGGGGGPYPAEVSWEEAVEIIHSGDLAEVVEVPTHPWYLGCQFHPEFKSKPMKPHPLFRDFIKAALTQQKKS